MTARRVFIGQEVLIGDGRGEERAVVESVHDNQLPALVTVRITRGPRPVTRQGTVTPRRSISASRR